ncbi:NAD(P)H-hydrate dehydratase [Persicitalea jodogahamensis]|uniref:Bifunctional NAD(P)H-hydrate repair enzyme n=1 Tax=Persicitalea jodogahamensis TaxID=402147 RepID=A0A8J3D743_9BACT|nr:NAD(P)H-hydrate dehydratase [Persicitalea jodogahamensis]GHB61235.1 bifunctional NAD(P)H-hydrate repair enzyme [Persicitalea jodogahamensis]
MNILNASQIRNLDAHTIQNEPISSLDLMERASRAFVRWLCARFDNRRPLVFFCGKGNNGGDGLAIARILSAKGYGVTVYVVDYTEKSSDDFSKNLQRLQEHLTVHYIKEEKDLPKLTGEEILIDALLGSGLTRPAEGLLAATIETMNESPARVISVDIASGLYMDKVNGDDDAIVRPDYTVSFQLPKLAFMIPQNGPFAGDWLVVDIGLNETYIEKTKTPYFFTDKRSARKLIRDREKFSHKGTFGHALLLAGSFGKMGAAQLCGGACLRSGVGLLTLHVAGCGYEIIQIALPEAMCSVDIHEKMLTTLPDLNAYSAIGVGPGLGKEPQTLQMLENLIGEAKVPMVWDADALNLLSENPDLLKKLPEHTIITPHPKEFERLAGKSKDDYARLELARSFAGEHKLIVVLKGAHTSVIFPDGTVHFNATGNAGMATGGAGDVLTGILTSLLAQKYSPQDAARLGVYQHGIAGDRAAKARTKTAMIASDIVENMGW